MPGKNICRSRNMLAFSPGWCSDIEQYTTEKDRKQETIFCFLLSDIIPDDEHYRTSRSKQNISYGQRHGYGCGQCLVYCCRRRVRGGFRTFGIGKIYDSEYDRPY